MAKQKQPGLEDIEAFVVKAQMGTCPVYVGIDPGVHGAIGFVCGNLFCVVDIPILTVARTRRVDIKAADAVEGGPKTKAIKGVANKYNNPAICAIFKALKPVRTKLKVCLEVGQIQGKAKGGGGNNSPRTAALAYAGYMMWPLFLCSKGYSVEELSPQDWKKTFQLIGKDKEASRKKAMSLWPEAPLARKSDNGRAEALLLAECLRRRTGAESG